MIVIESKRKRPESLFKDYPNAVFYDVTSKSPYKALQQLSPFYPWGEIPVSFSPGVCATCVEAVWQGLKVFENADIDTELFSNDTMKGLKRSSRVYGKVLGHRRGVHGETLLNYLDARRKIYIPTYKWMLENKAYESIQYIREFVSKNPNKTVVLLDYQTNCNVEDLSKPLSHAYLVKAYVEGNSPYEDIVIKTKVRRTYIGRRFIERTTIEPHFKELPADDVKDDQLMLDFDE